MSTTTWRLRPLISLPPSKPGLSDPTTASALTDWESITPALGFGSRPPFSRTPAAEPVVELAGQAVVAPAVEERVEPVPWRAWPAT